MVECGVNLYENNERKLLTLGGWISVLCLSVIFYLVYRCKIPLLRRHPINIIMRKSVLELLFVSQYLWMAFVPKSFFWKELNDDDSPCATNPYIWPLSWLTQFSLLGGELWFWVLSVDIHVALTNPFSNTISNSYFYSGIVIGISAVTATILVTVLPIEYGLSSDPMIWVRDKKNTTNWTKIGMFYLFVPMIYLYCGAVAIWARWQINRGLEATLRKRKYSVQKQTTYVIGYMMFWTCVYTFQFALYLHQELGFYLSSKAEYSFQLASGFLLASRGFWSLATFLVANWPSIIAYIKNEQQRLLYDGNAPPKEEEEQVQLNIALQREIVNFTALGIQRSVRDMDSFQEHTRSVSSRYSSFNLFTVKMPGEYVSFMVNDPSFSDESDNQENERSHSHEILHDQFATTESPMTRPSLSLSPRNSAFSRQLPPPGTTGSSPGDNSMRTDFVAYNIENVESNKQHKQHALDPNRHTLTAQLVEKLASAIISTRNSFHFTDYSPLLFARIRQLSGVNPENYIASFNSTTMPVFSEGRSGAFLYFSSDEQYIVKTTTSTEFERLLTMLPAYESYLASEKQRGRESLITRYLGAHRIVMYDIPLYFVVMKNICPIVDEKYDLKGSWINRHGSKRAKDPAKARPQKYYHTLTGSFRHSLGAHGDEKEPVPLFLDNDLKDTFLLSPSDATTLAQQLDRDTKFLRSFNLMDYSLLVGVKRRMYMVNPTSHAASRQNSTNVSGSMTDYSVRTSSVTAATMKARDLASSADMAMYTSVHNTSASSASATAGGGHDSSYVPPPPPESVSSPQYQPPTQQSLHQSYQPLSHENRKYTQSFSSLPPKNVSQSQGDKNNMIGQRYDAAAVEGAGAFYFGVIDILQEWDWRKWYERMFKVYFLQKNGDGLSATEPFAYRKRFMQRAVIDVFAGLDMSVVEDSLTTSEDVDGSDSVA